MSTPNFHHYILTRFNAGLYSSNPYGVKNPDEWMEHRVELFRETVKSVRSQTVKPTDWAIELDPKTPDRFVQLISNFGVWVIRKRPSEYLTVPTAKWLITTRLDNDDVILPHFIGSIQSKFREQEEVIDFDGTKRDLNGNEIDANRKSPSPFISLIEPWTNAPKTVLYQGGHARIGKKYPVVQVKKKGWVQIIHDRNLVNKM